MQKNYSHDDYKASALSVMEFHFEYGPKCLTSNFAHLHLLYTL
jgi:hypothetical protein